MLLSNGYDQGHRSLISLCRLDKDESRINL